MYKSAFNGCFRQHYTGGECHYRGGKYPFSGDDTEEDDLETIDRRIEGIDDWGILGFLSPPRSLLNYRLNDDAY
jgi:hypothetical protein